MTALADFRVSVKLSKNKEYIKYQMVVQRSRPN